MVLAISSCPPFIGYCGMNKGLVVGRVIFISTNTHFTLANFLTFRKSGKNLRSLRSLKYVLVLYNMKHPRELLHTSNSNLHMGTMDSPVTSV